MTARPTSTATKTPPRDDVRLPRRACLPLSIPAGSHSRRGGPGRGRTARGDPNSAPPSRPQPSARLAAPDTFQGMKMYLIQNGILCVATWMLSPPWTILPVSWTPPSFATAVPIRRPPRARLTSLQTDDHALLTAVHRGEFAINGFAIEISDDSCTLAPTPSRRANGAGARLRSAAKSACSVPTG